MLVFEGDTSTTLEIPHAPPRGSDEFEHRGVIYPVLGTTVEIASIPETDEMITNILMAVVGYSKARLHTLSHGMAQLYEAYKGVRAINHLVWWLFKKGVIGESEKVGAESILGPLEEMWDEGYGTKEGQHLESESEQKAIRKIEPGEIIAGKVKFPP